LFFSLSTRRSCGRERFAPDEYSTIIGAIHDSVDGDSVVIAPGVYHEYNIRFDGKAIRVMGTDPLNYQTVGATVTESAEC
jgi:hypothetical protein